MGLEQDGLQQDPPPKSPAAPPATLALDIAQRKQAADLDRQFEAGFDRWRVELEERGLPFQFKGPIGLLIIQGALRLAWKRCPDIGTQALDQFWDQRQGVPRDIEATYSALMVELGAPNPAAALVADLAESLDV